MHGTHDWPGSSVGIETGYWLDGPGIESQCGRDLPHMSRPALGPTQPSVQWFFPGGKGRLGSDSDPSLVLVPWSRKSRVIPLLPYGPYGLYRASVPVQGRTLPFYFCGTYYRVHINYRRNLQNRIFTNTEQKYMTLLQYLRPTTSKDTIRIARAHQHSNRERHTRHA